MRRVVRLFSARQFRFITACCIISARELELSNFSQSFDLIHRRVVVVVVVFFLLPVLKNLSQTRVVF